MLDLMRRKAQSPTLQATVVIIILVFIFWGVGNQGGNGPNTVLTVNGTPDFLSAIPEGLQSDDG